MKNIRGNEILFNYCFKIYDRKKNLVICLEIFVEGCKGWERKVYEFFGYKVYLIVVDLLFFLSFIKCVFRYFDLLVFFFVRYFVIGNLKIWCCVVILVVF